MTVLQRTTTGWLETLQAEGVTAVEVRGPHWVSLACRPGAARVPSGGSSQHKTPARPLRSFQGPPACPARISSHLTRASPPLLHICFSIAVHIRQSICFRGTPRWFDIYILYRGTPASPRYTVLNWITPKSKSLSPHKVAFTGSGVQAVWGWLLLGGPQSVVAQYCT